MRNFVIERNIFSATTGAPDGRELLISAVNATARDNIFYIETSAANPPFLGAQIAERGIEPVPQFAEIYNNTCYFLTTQSQQACIGFSGQNFSAPGINSVAQNNLFYSPSGNGFSINTGSGNTIANNTPTSSANPSITNGSSAFDLISDFKPTANYTGGVRVPVWYDALGIAWSPTWDYGAVHH
jgi:hypothetical protein